MNELNELAGAKIRRSEAAAALKVAAESVAHHNGEVAASKAHVAELGETRAGYIAAAKPVAVLAIDERLLKGHIGVEVAQARAAANAAKHSAAVAELQAADTAVAGAARAVVLAEMTALAVEVSRALDHALALGAKLVNLSMRDHLRTPLNVSVPMLPQVVEDTLARLPQPDQLNVPMHILRNGVDSRAWSQRVAELTT
jgi:hypothetical protein